MYRSFDDIVARAKQLGPANAAFLFPEDPDVLKAAADSMISGLVLPVLVGREQNIRSISRQIGFNLEGIEVVDQEDPQEAAHLCLDMAARREVRFVVKGDILTTYLYRALIKKTKEIAPDQTPCTICFHRLPGMNKIFAVTDPGVNILPSLEFKKKILVNAVAIFRRLGCAVPRIMVLAAPWMDGAQSRAFREADELVQLARDGFFGPCQMEPTHWLHELFAERGQPAREFPDLFLVPNIETGNILAKSIDHILPGVRQCITVGAGLVTLTPSRSDGYDIRSKNIALGIVLTGSEEDPQ